MTTARIVGRLLASGLCLSGLVALGQAQSDQQNQQNQQRQEGQGQSSQLSSSQHQMTPEHFAYGAALGGLKEVHLAQVAMNKAQKSEVRQLATTILNDHKQANQELMRIASQKGLNLPSTNVFDQASRSSDRQPVGGKDPGDASTRSERDTQRDPAASTAADRATGRDTHGEDQMKQECLQDIQRLEALSGQQFDQAYAQQMVKDHQKAIEKFEAASRTLTDNELKRFASDTLPKLRAHLQHAQQLTSAAGGSSTLQPRTQQN